VVQIIFTPSVLPAH